MFDSSDQMDTATYTSADLSKLLQCSLRHVRNLDAQRSFPGRIQIGRLIRFSKVCIDKWLALDGCQTKQVDGGAQ